MKSLHGLIRQSALALMAGLLLVFSVLIYVGGDALLRRFVDGRLLGLAETLAKIVEQHPNLLESSGEDFALAAEVGRSEKEQHELQEVAHSLLVFSPDGRVVWKGTEAVAQHPVPDDKVFERVRRGNTVFETVESADGTPIRHLFLPIPRQGQVRYVLHAEASLLLYQETLKGLVILLTLGSGTILLVGLDRQWVAGQESPDSDRGVEHWRRNDVRSRPGETINSGFTLSGISSADPGFQLRDGPVPTER